MRRPVRTDEAETAEIPQTSFIPVHAQADSEFRLIQDPVAQSRALYNHPLKDMGGKRKHIFWRVRLRAGARRLKAGSVWGTVRQGDQLRQKPAKVLDEKGGGGCARAAIRLLRALKMGGKFAIAE